MRKTDQKGIADCFQNRELSWLKFNERVLNEANCTAIPPLERLKFISIFCSNMDEFFMIRVGSLTDLMLFVPGYFDNKTEMTAEQQLDAVFQQTASLYTLKDRCFHSVMVELGRHGIHHMKMCDLNNVQLSEVEKHYQLHIMPLLSPQIIDNRHHPFPHIENLRLNIAVRLENKKSSLYGLIPVPSTLKRVFLFDGGCRFVLLEDIILHFSDLAFEPYKVLEKTILSVTRNADISTEVDDATDEDIDYRQVMKRLVKKRMRQMPVRMEIQNEVGKVFKAFFLKKLNLKEEQVFFSESPLDATYSFMLEEKFRSEGREKLFMPTHIPFDGFSADIKNNLIKRVLRKDCLLSFPYVSMSPFLEMIRQSADDPAVLSIKITLYRIDFQSRLADSLTRAAENGKEVVVLMELRARFDETNNIEWSHRLEEAGCKIIYGLPGYKVHSKICLITKREHGKLLYITQIGTGNYNEKTAKLYTDLSLITANQSIGADAATFFNNLLLGSISGEYSSLWVAPSAYKVNIIRCIEEEKRRAHNGDVAEIMIKCNSLSDKEIIIKLIEASQSGVKITLIIRGICCLIPHIPELTHNITVVSIVGKFLEHSRVFCFGTGDRKKVYISSADLMTRNTERRVEIACPVLDADIKQQICDMLEIMLMDNTKAWEQFSDSRYIARLAPSDLVINSQYILIEQARAGHATTGHVLAGSNRTKRYPGLQGIIEDIRNRVQRLAERVLSNKNAD